MELLKIPDSPYTRSVQKGLDLSIAQENPEATANFLSAAGDIYFDKKMFPEAAECYKKHIDYYEKPGISQSDKTAQIEFRRWEKARLRLCKAQHNETSNAYSKTSK
ncbi:MAG: hypothetical protein HZB65_03575 [Candidatus Aenigmarchaeota archaeon]|nr:hypothetical protein [Candidatus Aenigmarchaeota archaeon]